MKNKTKKQSYFYRPSAGGQFLHPYYNGRFINAKLFFGRERDRNINSKLTAFLKKNLNSLTNNILTTTTFYLKLSNRGLIIYNILYILTN